MAERILGASRPIMVVCGAPGSGKTWVCKQLIDKFEYVPHDKYIKVPRSEFIDDLLTASTRGPVVTECPFGETDLIAQVAAAGAMVDSVFIVEPVDTVAQRYRSREGKEPMKSILSRASNIEARAREWGKPFGTSEQVLEYLKNILI